MKPEGITVARAPCQHGQWQHHIVRNTWGRPIMGAFDVKRCYDYKEVWLFDGQQVTPCENGKWMPAWGLHGECAFLNTKTDQPETHSECDGRGWT